MREIFCSGETAAGDGGGRDNCHLGMSGLVEVAECGEWDRMVSEGCIMMLLELDLIEGLD